MPPTFPSGGTNTEAKASFGPLPPCPLTPPVPLRKISKKLGLERDCFGERTRGEVILYQDAHVRDGELPEIELENGRVFRQE